MSDLSTLYLVRLVAGFLVGWFGMELLLRGLRAVDANLREMEDDGDE
jgi:hypothetical protein